MRIKGIGVFPESGIFVHECQLDHHPGALWDGVSMEVGNIHISSVVDCRNSY